nr:Arm DNA-binding domain-containing protein [Burkholderia cepacia]
MGALTVRQIEAAKATGKRYFLSDGRGLFLRVGPAGGRTGFVRVSINGKQRDKPLGKTWVRSTTDAQLSLEDARAAAETIRSQARDGVDFLEAKKRERQAKVEQAVTADLTFGDLFDAWFATINKKRGKKGRKDGGKSLRGAMEKHVLPTIRAHRIAGVFASNVLPLLTAISDGGCNRQAVEMLVTIQQMIRWGGLSNKPDHRQSDASRARAEHALHDAAQRASGRADVLRKNGRASDCLVARHVAALWTHAVHRATRKHRLHL